MSILLVFEFSVCSDRRIKVNPAVSCTNQLDNTYDTGRFKSNSKEAVPDSEGTDDTEIYIGISDIDFLSSKTGFITISYSKVNNSNSETTYKLLETQDGGHHWVRIGDNDFIESTIFVDEKLGFGVQCTDKQDIAQNMWVKTTDGGKTFKDITDYGDSHPVPDFINSREGYAIFDRTGLYHTIDGGVHWEKIMDAESNNCYYN